MNDTELFELCKEVYERTGWDESGEWWCYEWDDNDYKTGEKSIESDHWIWYTSNSDKKIHPAYTSDYLLEKLPPSIQSKEYPGKPAFLWTRKEDDSLDKYPEGRISYFAWYFVTGIVDGASDYGEHADSTLKALLKLTIALHEAKAI